MEQRVHDYLAALPFAALSLVLVFHWRELAPLVRDPLAALSEPLRFRSPPLPAALAAGIFGLVLIGNLAPYLEEFLRALRYRARSGR